MNDDLAHHYDIKYRGQNCFRYREWLYAPYVSSLIDFCGLPQGSSVLHVECGQECFSYLFHNHGMKVSGIDVSETGIRTAKKVYGRFGITFVVADIHAVVFPERFDCMFVRSCRSTTPLRSRATTRRLVNSSGISNRTGYSSLRTARTSRLREARPGAAIR